MKWLKVRSPAATALGVALLLTACGGGGKGDDIYSTPPASKSLTLNGLVTDGPIAGARVTVRIGSQTFTAVAGSDGRYLLPITIPADAGGSLVVIEAQGPASGPNSKVSLLSLTSSFDSLLAAAGSDGQLSNSEAPAINVTHLSTANAVLVIELTGATPSSEAALRQAESAIDPEAALELAAAIKLIVDSPTEYSLPTGSANTLQFAQNRSAREEFIETAKEENPEDFSEAQEATVSDSNVAPPPSNTARSLTYIASIADQDSFNFTDQAQLFNLASGGTGDFISRLGKQPIHWSVQGNVTRINQDEPVVAPGYWTYGEYIAARDGFYDCFHEPSYGLFEIVSLSAKSARIKKTGNDHQTCSGYSNLNQAFEEFERDTVAEDISFVTSISAENVLSAPDLSTAKGFALYTLKLSQESDFLGRIGADVLSFDPGGSGSSRFFAGNFTWQRSTDGKTLTLTFANGVVSTYQTLRDIDTRASVVLFTTRKPDGQVYADINLRFATATLEPLTPNLVPGAYYQFGFGDESVENDPYRVLKGFWLEYYGDGTGRQITDFYEYDEHGDIRLDESGKPITSENRNASSTRFFWSSTANSITNTRTYNNAEQVNGTRFSSCSEGSADCVVWDRREVFPVNFVERQNDDRVYVLERRQINNDDRAAGIQSDSITTHLLRYYDIRDLPTPGKAAKPASEEKLRAAGKPVPQK